MMVSPAPDDPTYRYRADQLYMDDVPLAEIAAAAGTPVYIYSLRRIHSQLDRLRAAFASLNPGWHYSIKANGSGAILRALVAAGCGCDAVSTGEIFLALRAGCPAAQIVFAGVGKTAADIRYALEQQVGWLNTENTGELALTNALARDLGRRGVPVALRINPNLHADTHAYIATGHAGAKFGIGLAEARTLLADRAAYPALHIAGLHTHIGSQLGRPDESAAAARLALDMAREFGLTHLNLGGGFPVAYDGSSVPPVEAFAAALVPVLQDQNVQIAFEPGRYLIAEAGVLLAEVQYVKNSGQTIVLDAGMTDLIRPALYQARHPLWPVEAARGDEAARQVVGPICESADVLHPSALLPALEPGALVAIGVAGAYGMAMASNYNGRPRPAEVLVEGNTWRVIRQRERFDDLARLEI